MPPAGRKPSWMLTTESFQGLLAFLDGDPRRAAEKYEKIREKLTRFFEWKGCIPGDEFTDLTFDRVSRRLEEGIEASSDPYLFIHGVAVNVAKERWRKADTDTVPLSEATIPAPALGPLESTAITKFENERGLDCLYDCIDRLTPLSRDLLTTYHLGQPGVRIGRRKGLAERLNIPAAALRLRVYRIRRNLETCVHRCLQRHETQIPGGH